jgi:hypothetical protein
MRRSRFSDKQILAIVKEGEAGRNVSGLCREWDHRANVLALESQVRRDGAE